MKKLWSALVIATTLPFSAQANDTSVALEMCKPIHRLAETIMERRQEGTSLVKMLEIANSSDMEGVKAFAILMVEEAYASTRFHTRENQLRAVQDFGNDNFKLCMELMKEIEK